MRCKISLRKKTKMEATNLPPMEGLGKIDEGNSKSDDAYECKTGFQKCGCP